MQKTMMSIIGGSCVALAVTVMASPASVAASTPMKPAKTVTKTVTKRPTVVKAAVAGAVPSASTVASGSPVGVPAGDYTLSVPVTATGTPVYIGAVVQRIGGTGAYLRVANFHPGPSGYNVTAAVRIQGPSDQFFVVVFSAATVGQITLTPASWSYVVRGTAITSPTSANVILHGVSVNPTLITNQVLPTLLGYTRANVVRVEVDECMYLPYFTSAYQATYRQTVIDTVNAVTSAGGTAVIALMTSCHDLATSAATPGAQVGPDQHAVPLWTDLATTFANQPKVMFELFNEPQMNPTDAEPNGLTGEQVWRDGGELIAGGFTWTSPGMETLYNTVRATGAMNVVLVDGTGYASNLLPAERDPVDGTNIVYAYHAYALTGSDPSQCPPMLNTTVEPVISPTGSYGEAGMATEFGTTVPAPTGSNYLSNCIQWFNNAGTGWIVYGWYPTAYDAYGLLANWPMAQTPRATTVMTLF